VWKHTLADLFPPSPETALHNQEVKSSAFLKQEQEPQPFIHKPSDSLGKQESAIPLKAADCLGEGFPRFLFRFADKESNLFCDCAVSTFQARITYYYEVLNRLSGYSDICNFILPVQIYQHASPNPVYSKGGLLPHAFH